MEGRPPKACGEMRVVEKLAYCSRYLYRIRRPNEQPCSSMLEDLSWAAERGSDDRLAEHHCLHQDEAESFASRGMDKNVQGVNPRIDISLVPCEIDSARQVEPPREIAEIVRVAALPA